MSASEIDWRGLADKLDTITWTETGRSERGGTDLACKALIEIIGDAAFRNAVDFYTSGQPGHELARSVLWHLRPPAAMERCREIFRAPQDEQEAADAINLLQVIADRRVLEWVPEFLESDNQGVRIWALGIVDQLLIMQEEIGIEEAMPLISKCLNDTDERVRARAAQIQEWFEHNQNMQEKQVGEAL